MNMTRTELLHFMKEIYPIQITGGEEILDDAIWELSKRFVRAINPEFPEPDIKNLPVEPWWGVVSAFTEQLLQGRTGKVYFTKNSFPFLNKG